MSESARTRDFFCLGCGMDITSYQDDRRALGGARAKKVVEVWKNLTQNLIYESEEEADHAVALSEMATEEEKMCRKCFNSFDRYSKLLTEIEENLRQSVRCQLAQEGQQPVHKRPRVAKSVSNTSPSVSVSLYIHV